MNHWRDRDSGPRRFPTATSTHALSLCFHSTVGKGLGAFSDLARLTMFADYRVPQVLRHIGILK